jgi:hypothetical protein
MHLRFSLRTFFVLVTLLAGCCYFWFVIPTVTANRFAQSIAVKDYKSADRLFSDHADRFIADSAEKYWAFESTAELMPITFGQLMSGRRHVALRFDYFHLDQNVSSVARIPATPFGLESPVVSRIDSDVTIGTSSAVPQNR